MNRVHYKNSNYFFFFFANALRLERIRSIIPYGNTTVFTSCIIARYIKKKIKINFQRTYLFFKNIKVNSFLTKGTS